MTKGLHLGALIIELPVMRFLLNGPASYRHNTQKIP
jgi:hypothetical protein